MNTRIEPISEQHGFLCITLNSEDYLPKFNDELKRIKKTARIKGFRHGSAPDSMIQKLYGDELKADILNKLLNKTIEDYQKSNDVQFIGDVMEVPDQNQSIDDGILNFKFEVGIAPNPQIKSIIDGLNITKYKVIIPEERIDEEVEHLRTKMGESSETDGPVIKDDYVDISAVEMDGDKIKVGGWETEFPVVIGEFTQDKFKDVIIGLKKSDSFVFNIKEIETNLSEKDISKYLLKLPDDHPSENMPGDIYQMTITKIQRRQAAELTEEFYKKAFGPDTTITSEEDLRKSLRENLEKYFESETSKLLDIELVKKIVKNSEMKYPDEFLTKWLKSTYEEWRDKEGHALEHEMLHFKEGLSWKIIREKILLEEKLQINYNDLSAIVMAEFKTQYPAIQLPDETWNELTKRALSNKEKSMHYFVEAQNQKVLNWLKQEVNKTDESISLDDFREKVKQINEHHH